MTLADQSLTKPAKGAVIPTKRSQAPTTVLIPLITPYLYGMERAVIEAFDALRPEIEPSFVQSSRITERNPPIIQEMRRRGFQTALLPDKTDWEAPSRPRSLRHLFGMLVSVFRSNTTILKASRGKQILYVPSLRASLFCIFAALMYRLTGRRVVHHFHDLGTDMPGARYWFLLVTDCIHNTEFSQRVVTQNLPKIKGKRNVVVPYILEVEPRVSEDRAIRHILEGKRNIFYIGQVSRHKGVDILAKAFKMIASEHQDLTLHLVGGYQEDFRRQLESDFLSESSLAGRIMFWGYREDVMRLLPWAYLYVQSSPPARFHESFGRSVVEAMAFGVPTVCFRSGALQEIVVHEETGLICDEGATALAAALKRFAVQTSVINAPAMHGNDMKKDIRHTP
jgi:glycosyltransferase involved in cell wall biosynthesis